MPERFLIINADDFGLTPAVNRGVATAHERGVVTSASLMVRGAAAVAAGEYARAHTELAVGLHIDLAEWSFVDGEWRPDYEVVDARDADAVAAEVGRQLAAFVELVDRTPTHLDSHQHVHREEPVASLLGKIAGDLDVPLRGCDPRVDHRGDFYGQSGKGEPAPQLITVDALERVIVSLGDGWTELACHPGEPDDELESMYGTERSQELATLCDPRVREVIDREGIELCSFADLPPR